MLRARLFFNLFEKPRMFPGKLITRVKKWTGKCHVSIVSLVPAQDELVGGDDGTTVEFESGVSILTGLP